MFYISVIILVTFTFSTCLAKESSTQQQPSIPLGNKGVVFEWTTEETFKLMLMYSEKKDNKLDYWFEVAEKKFHLSCSEFHLKDRNGNMIKTTRAYITVVDHGYEREETDVDDFEVASCDEDLLMGSDTILFAVPEVNKYVLSFKDKENNCYQREIKVEATDLTVAVHRAKPVEKRCRHLNIPKTSVGQIVPYTWMDDGVLYDIDYPEGGVKKYHFGDDKKCTNCWLFCRQVKKHDKTFSIIDILIYGIPIDRVKTSSCTKYSVKASITIDFFGPKVDKVKNFQINYLDTNGACHSKTYEFDQQDDEKNRFIKRLSVLKGELKKGNGCYKMKVQGVLRHLGKVGISVKEHIGKQAIAARSLCLTRLC